MKARSFAEIKFRAARHVSAAMGRVIVGLALLLAPYLNAEEVRPTRAFITKEEVRDALSAELRTRGVPGDQLPQPDNIELPTAIPAAAHRTLHVAGWCWNAALARMQFRIECRDAECLPFLAYAGTTRRIGQSCQETQSDPPVRTAPRKTIVRAGDRATVVYRSSRMRLTANVTCLERGAEGDVIRVRNQDGHIFRVRVSTATLLETVPQ